MDSILIVLMLAMISGAAGSTMTTTLSRLAPVTTLEALRAFNGFNLTQFESLTGLTITIENYADIEAALYSVLRDHFEHRSLFMKLASLVTFYNAVSILSVCAVALFLLFLSRDLYSLRIDVAIGHIN